MWPFRSSNYHRPFTFPIYKPVSPLLPTLRFLGSLTLCSVPVGTPSWMSEHIAKIQIPVGKMNFIPIVAALTTSRRIVWKHGKAAMGRMLHSALSPFLKITEGKEAPWYYVAQESFLHNPLGSQDLKFFNNIKTVHELCRHSQESRFCALLRYCRNCRDIGQGGFYFKNYLSSMEIYMMLR